jgi:glyoxylase-like metal-dependent hydrolase (beta-lactamase superfamily II)
MGGEQALRGLGTTVVEFNTAAFGLGQEETSQSPARGPISWGRVSTDWRGGRRALAQESRAVSGVTTRLRQVVAGEIGMAETNGAQTALAAGAVVGILRGMRLSPERMLLQALDNPATTRTIPARVFRGEMMDGVRLALSGDSLSLYFDRPSGRLVVAETVTDDPILGDRRSATWYTRWQASGGVTLPRQIDVDVNGRALSQTNVTSLTVNGALPDSVFAIADSIRNRATRASAATPPTVAVQLVELSPGVWRVEGGTHHSLLVDQGAQLVLVEAPQSAARTNAVLDTVRSRFPRKPIGLVANSHHHWDHSGGVRAAMAAGHRIVTHQRNLSFVRGIATARKTVAPDGLSRRQAIPVITAVADSLIVGTGDRRVVLYNLPTTHVEGMLAAYVPGARVLFAADVLTPGPTLASLGSAELVAMVRARGLAVDRFAGGHGTVVPWADVEKAAGLP